jgi:protein O-mannose beta-1,4-N-acetylglucosaminyltransferase
MKGGGKLQQPLRLESQRFRLLSIVVGCFVICLVFLLSSRPDATAFDTGQCSTHFSSTTHFTSSMAC